MEKLVETLPTGERVVSFTDLYHRQNRNNAAVKEGALAQVARRFLSMSGGRLKLEHLLSRACVGHCFDYMNYEPATGQFRIHAAPGNSVVVASYADQLAMVNGTYVVKASDLPLYALIQCGPGPTEIFIRPMAKGESGATLACPQATVPQE
jgi:hypothetical protein